jgi:glucose/arabinose dehydrogenase
MFETTPETKSLLVRSTFARPQDEQSLQIALARVDTAEDQPIRGAPDGSRLRVIAVGLRNLRLMGAPEPVTTEVRVVASREELPKAIG